MSQNTLANPASAKQEGFITNLWRGADNLLALTPEQHDILNKVLAAEHVEKSEASYLIDGLLRCPKRDLPQAKPGYYIHQNGDYLVVVQNKAKTKTYAKCLEVTKEPGQRGKAKWVYAPGKGAEVAHMTPMTLDQAAKFGHLYGVCFVCCKALTDPASVKRGIGPVCAKKFGGRPVAKKAAPAPVVQTHDDNQPEIDLAMAEAAQDAVQINVAALRRRNRKP